MLDDSSLLRRYAELGSESAFAELVQRHLDLVYSVALRQVNGDVPLAQEVAQLVFIDVARQAGPLARHPVFAGWLFTATRYAAAKAVRAERRRRSREHAAFLMQTAQPTDSEPALEWERLRPVLDDALAELTESDRLAILLRFFEKLDYAGIGARLGLSANTARMRVDRALDKLGLQLEHRGISSPISALTTVLAGSALIAAPAGLAGTVTSVAIAAPAAGLAASVTLMSATKLQIGAAVVLAVGSGLYVTQDRQNELLRTELANASRTAAPAPARPAPHPPQPPPSVDPAALRAANETALADLQAETDALQTKLQRQGQTASATGRGGRPRRPVNISELDQRPRPRLAPPPTYPAGLAAAERSGEVVVEFIIDSEGNVRDPRVVRSSDPAFDAATLAGIARWKFDPGVVGIERVDTRVTQLVKFSPSTQANHGPGNWF